MVPSGGTGSWTFYAARDGGTLNAHIYDCPNAAPTTTEVTGGTVVAAGPTNLPVQANPLSMPVATGDYQVSATAPAGYQFVACGTYQGQSTLPATVTTDTAGSAIFYVKQLPGSLLATIYLCTPAGVQSQTVSPGSVVTSPSVTITNGVAVTVPAGTYLVTATPGTGFELVKCGASGDNPQSVVVTPGGNSQAIYYEQPIPVQAVQAVTTGPTQPNTGLGTSGLLAAVLVIYSGLAVMLRTRRRNEEALEA